MKKLKRPSLHRTFGDKKLRITVATGHAVINREGIFTERAIKKEAVNQLKRLRKEGYQARMVYSKTFGYLVYSNKPWYRIPW